MRQKVFLLLARLTCSRPISVLVLWLCAASMSLLLASHLKMMTGRTDLLSPDNPHVRRYTDFTREFGTANSVYFIVESDSLKRSKQCADELAAEIEQHPKYIRDVLYKLNFSQMEQKFFLHLSRPQLEQINEYLEKNNQLLKTIAAARNLNDLFPAMGELAKKRVQDGFEHPATVIELRVFAALLEGMNSYLWGKERPGINFFTALAADSLPFGMAEDPEGYLVGKNKRAVVLAARPNAEKEDSLDFLKPMMDVLLQARENALKKFPGVTIGLTGLPTFAYGDLHVMEEKMVLLFLLALLAAVVLCFLFFRHPIEILFSGISLVCALICTLGAAYLLIGHLNIMSSVFAVTLVSLGIDFGIHFIARFNSEVSQSDNFDEAIQATFTGSGPAVATGALTTAAAFFMLYFTDFRGLAELGLIAGTGILFCLLSMLTVLPSLIVLRHRWRPVSAGRQARTEFLLDRILLVFARAASKHAELIVAGFAAGTLLMCFFVPQVSFDYNFLHIQPKSSTTGEYEDVLMERTGLSPSFAVIVDDDMQSLEKKVDNLSGQPSIARIEAATYLVPLHQSDNIDIIDSIRRNLIVIGGPLNRNHDAPDIKDLILQFQEMKKGIAAARDIQTVLEKKEIKLPLEHAQKAVDTFLKNMEKANRTEVSQKLETFSSDLFTYLEGQFEALSEPRQLDAVRFEDYPENIETRFVGKTGKYAAYVFPSQSIWNIHFLEKFNNDILEAAPDATGTTMFAQALLQITGRALRQSALLVTLAVVLLVFADFRKIIPATLSLLSVALGLVWMLGTMKLLGWQYNPINIMAVPIVLGIGIDSGVHIVHRFQDSGGDARAAVLTSGRAIMVSSLTTIAGFACLLLSTHRGLITLAQLLLLGMSACLVASLVVLPAILHILSRPQDERKQETNLI